MNNNHVESRNHPWQKLMENRVQAQLRQPKKTY